MKKEKSGRCRDYRVCGAAGAVVADSSDLAGRDGIFGALLPYDLVINKVNIFRTNKYLCWLLFP